MVITITKMIFYLNKFSIFKDKYSNTTIVLIVEPKGSDI